MDKERSLRIVAVVVVISILLSSVWVFAVNFGLLNQTNSDSSEQEPFIITAQLDSPYDTYDIDPEESEREPFQERNYTFPINHGESDGEYSVAWYYPNGTKIGSKSGISGNYIIDLPDAGTYEIQITGDIERFSAGDESYKINSIEQWGDVEWETMDSMFYDAGTLGYNATDSPDLSNVESTRFMFAETSINADISDWDTSNVENMEGMFYNAESFDQDISDWDTRSVYSMNNLFSGAVSFNSDISSWNTSNVTNMNSMFRGATSFNRDLSNWDTSNVVDMSYMFSDAESFNGDISGWDTRSVKSDAYADARGNSVSGMNQMFLRASSFNQDISNWCVEHIEEKPRYFDRNSGFQGESELQPNWSVPC